MDSGWATATGSVDCVLDSPPLDEAGIGTYNENQVKAESDTDKDIK